MRTEFVRNSDGEAYKLIPFEYVPVNQACMGCAFKPGGSPRCTSAPTCTPKGLKGQHVWVLAHEQLELDL